jgi:hypothetical protein
MQALNIRLCLISLALSAAAVPALASNHPKADSRPISSVSERSRSAVDAEARAWTRSVSPNGYVGSSRQAAVQVNANSRTAIDAESHAATRSVSPNGYVGSSRQAAVQVNENSRTRVAADASNWMRSGLATIEYGQVGADLANPAYKQAAQAYAARRDASDRSATVQALGANGTVAP